MIAKIIDRIKFYLFYQFYYASRFKHYGKHIRWGRDFAFCCIPKSIRLSCPHLIELGDRCQIDEGVYLQCHWQGQGISLGNGVRINAHTHILSYSAIRIEDRTLIAPFVLITSGNHGRPVESMAIMDCAHRPSGAITIGRGSWIGQKASIIGGVSLAPQTTVACYAVVTKSFSQDKVLIAGCPAKILNDREAHE